MVSVDEDAIRVDTLNLWILLESERSITKDSHLIRLLNILLDLDSYSTR